ncbi:hypothetical protein [Pelosinus sp. UFO1]|uniref:hypothetical protein n=1 Tax=Pelosinus sp. UFO1 TaxID=484770 RepID=UPI0004D0FD3C|nr:hypothetical protein [Pelosinus sp. UFO1]AIF51310.1 hypothetical protein UFO1_1759 [Pelosinus sp. UFO1]
MKLKVSMIVFFLLLSISIPVLASSKIDQYMSNARFSSVVPLETVLDNGVSIKFVTLMTGYLVEDWGKSYYTSKQGLLGVPYTATVEGVRISINNPTTKVAIMKWSESNLSIDSFSGIPFLDGMKYRDAGNPAFTPNTIIMPGQIVEKSLFISNITYAASMSTMKHEWQVIGVPIRRDGTTKATVTFNLILGNDQPQYHSISTPPIIIQ